MAGVLKKRNTDFFNCSKCYVGKVAGRDILCLKLLLPLFESFSSLHEQKG